MVFVGVELFRMLRRVDADEDGVAGGDARTPMGCLNASALASWAMVRVSVFKYVRLDASQNTFPSSIHMVLRMGSATEVDCGRAYM